eukprot:13939-Heterococcus_DN1.PRE.3
MAACVASERQQRVKLSLAAAVLALISSVYGFCPLPATLVARQQLGITCLSRRPVHCATLTMPFDSIGRLVLVTTRQLCKAASHHIHHTCRAAQASKEELYAAIKPTKRGADITRAQEETIDRLIRELEPQSPIPSPMESEVVNGRWALRYTNMPSVLGKFVGPGFRPKGEIYQDIDVPAQRMVNEQTTVLGPRNIVEANIEVKDGSSFFLRYTSTSYFFIKKEAPPNQIPKQLITSLNLQKQFTERCLRHARVLVASFGTALCHHMQLHESHTAHTLLCAQAVAAVYSGLMLCQDNEQPTAAGALTSG